jgi:MoaA/NifB/PqqE/SkfB family radical SAM enzyme
MTARGAAFLQIEPTTRCNFTCGFCAGRHMPQEDLTWDTFVATLDTFPEARHVELQGEGESLLHPRFHEMVAELRRRDVAVSFITNGSLLSARHVETLFEAGIEKISVSIESPDPAEFRRIRGGKLEKVVRNLEHLMAERARRGLARPVVGFSVTVLRSTWDQQDAIFALYRQLGLDGGITMQPLQAMETYAKHYDPTLQDEGLDPARAERIFLAFFANAELRAIQAERPPTAGFYEEMMAGWRPALRTCPYLDGGLYVHRDGAITACCMVKDTDKHALGQVGVTPREEVLARREALRTELATGSIPEPCQGCTLANFAVMSTPGLMAFGLRGLYYRLFG